MTNTLPPVDKSGCTSTRPARSVGAPSQRPAGDAATEITGVPYRIGPVSSIGAIAVVNALKTRTAELLVERGVVPTVLTSPHFVGSAEGEEQLERVYEEYFRRVKRAYDGDGALPVPESTERVGVPG